MIRHPAASRFGPQPAPVRALTPPFVALMSCALILSVVPDGSEAQPCPTPTPLASGVSVHATSDPSVYSVTPAEGRWLAVTVRAQDANNWDLEARDATAPFPTCLSGDLASSAGSGVDLLAMDGRFRPPQTDYISAGTIGLVGTSARVEYEQPAFEVQPNRPFELVPTGPNDIITVREMLMFHSIPYSIRIYPSASLTALKVYIFSPVGAGSGWLPKSARQVELALVPDSENRIDYYPPVNGHHAIVIVNEDGATGDFYLTIGRCPFVASVPAQGVPLLLSGLDEWPGFTPPAPAWAAVGVRGSVGHLFNLDVAPSPRSQFGPYHACTDSILGSQFSGLGTRVVTADFLTVPLRSYTAHANLEGQPQTTSLGYYEWDGATDEIVVNAGPVAITPPVNNVLDAWSILLDAGVAYDFDLVPDGGATASYELLLFGNPNPGTAYWASLPDAVFQTTGSGMHVPAISGLYGLMVVNDNGGTGGYSLSVTSGSVGVVPGSPRGALSRIRTAAPNPTTGAMRIEFELADAGQAEFRVRDVAGRTVATLSAGPHGAGVATFPWDGATRDGSRIAAGVYFVSLVVDGREADRTRIIVLR